MLDSLSIIERYALSMVIEISEEEFGRREMLRGGEAKKRQRGSVIWSGMRIEEKGVGALVLGGNFRERRAGRD